MSNAAATHVIATVTFAAVAAAATADATVTTAAAVAVVSRGLGAYRVTDVPLLSLLLAVGRTGITAC